MSIMLSEYAGYEHVWGTKAHVLGHFRTNTTPSEVINDYVRSRVVNNKATKSVVCVDA